MTDRGSCCEIAINEGGTTRERPLIQGGLKDAFFIKLNKGVSKMKKIMRLLVIVILSIINLNITSVIKAQDDIDFNGEVIVGVDDTFAPYTFKDDKGNYVGFDVELADEIFKRIGIKKYRFQPIDWSMKETELSTGNIDMIWSGYSITPEREKMVDFTDVYLAGRQGILVKKESEFETKADLAGKIVATQEGSSQLEALKNDPEFTKSLDGGQAITFQTFAEVLNDLSINRVDAIVVDETIASYYFKQNGQAKDYRMLAEDFGKGSTAVGVRKGNKEFITKFNEALKAMREDGTYDKIKNNWFADFASAESPE